MGSPEIFPVLADATRRRIIETLSGGDRAVGDLVESLGVSQPTVSKHLKVLRDAGVVTTRADGQRRFYAVAPGPLTAAADWLRGVADHPVGAPAVEPAGVAAVDATPAANVGPEPALVPEAAALADPAPPAAVVPEPTTLSVDAAAPAAGTGISATETEISTTVDAAPAVARWAPDEAPAEAPAAQLGRTVGRTVEQVTGRAHGLLERLPRPKFGRRR